MKSSANSVTAALCGHWYGDYGTAPCPVCQTERRSDQNALTLRDGCNGQLLADCKKSRCSFSSIRAALAFRCVSVTTGPADPIETAQRDHERRAEAVLKANRALEIWMKAKPVQASPAERYLREARGIAAPLPDTLRFHPATRHPSGVQLPALLAKVAGIELFALHRTYLASDGTGKVAAQPDKAMLGPSGGGAVRLSASHAGPLVVCEGIETGLSLVEMIRVPAMVWAALSAPGMKSLRLPSPAGQLIVATDGDDPGREAGAQLAQRAASLGWRVDKLAAPDGTDWNDYLREGKRQ